MLKPSAWTLKGFSYKKPSKETHNVEFVFCSKYEKLRLGWYSYSSQLWRRLFKALRLSDVKASCRQNWLLFSKTNSELWNLEWPRTRTWLLGVYPTTETYSRPPTSTVWYWFFARVENNNVKPDNSRKKNYTHCMRRFRRYFNLSF